MSRISLDLTKIIKNPAPIRRSVVLMLVRPNVRELLWPILNAVGRDKLQFLIDTDKPFHKYLPPQWLSTLQSAEARKWAWALDVLTEEDYFGMLPPWIVEVASRDPKTYLWVKKEIDWLKYQVKGIGGDPWLKTPAAPPETPQ
jgi:hypothetical protein